MKVLMLGWEYPPHIAGGLGTACEGLTAALAAQGVSIHFVVPQMFGGEQVNHMQFSCAASGGSLPREEANLDQSFEDVLGQRRIRSTYIPAFLTPYWNQQSFLKALSETRFGQAAQQREPSASSPKRYQTSIFTEVERFTGDVIERFADVDFDLIHAHDWMTFPAAVALARRSKRPLVAHLHSLEHDRSGVFYDRNINAIERFGLQSADRVIAVSHYTKSLIQRHHEIPQAKISVVHNGAYPRHIVNEYRQLKTWPTNVVLFLGRVTFQKGPEYFVEVARRVIPHLNDTLFVLAGDGDLLPKVREMVEEFGLKDYFLIPGFVQGEELEELFSVADLYVMPSVSEPFGITALEAISYDTPILISKQSGVSEVVKNALKVDFWDTDRMADFIINALTYQELRQELVEKARDELAKLHWGAAATKTIEVYEQLRSLG